MLFSKKITQYDSLGRVRFVSEWMPSTANDPPVQCTGTNTSTLGTCYKKYDALGRVGSVTTADQKLTTFSYTGSTDKRVVTTVNNPAENVTTDYTSDMFGRLHQVLQDKNNMNLITTYDYDALNNLIEVHQNEDQGEQQTRTFSYDALSNLTSSANPENGTVGFTYDARGNVDTRTDAKGITLDYTYDSAERLTILKANGAIIKEIAYDTVPGASLGKIANERSCLDTNPNATCGNISGSDFISKRLYEYNGLQGRISKVTTEYNVKDPLSQNYYSKVAYEYNDLGLLDRVSYYDAKSNTVQRVLDYGFGHGFLNNILSCVPLGQGNIDCNENTNGVFKVLNSATYNEAGGLKQYINGNNLVTAIAPDSRNRISRIYVTNNNNPIFDTGNYQYDGSGNITAIGLETFSYDHLNRLEDATIYYSNDPGEPPPQHCDVHQKFTYDRFGNLLFMDEARPCGSTLINKFSETYLNNQFQGAKFSYDLNGNLTKSAEADLDLYYNYDAQNQMTEYSTSDNPDIAHYYYDANAMRVIKELTDENILYVHDQAGNVIQEYYINKSDGSLKKVKDYLYFNGNLLASVDSDETAPAIDIVIPPEYLYANDNIIPFFWSIADPDSTLLYYQYGLHQCQTQSCDTEGCAPNVCIAEPCPPPQTEPYYPYTLPVLTTNTVPQASEPTIINAELQHTTRYRIAVKSMNEAKLTTVACSAIVLVDKQAPVISLLQGPGYCHPFLTTLTFSWDGADGEGESGLALNEQPCGKTTGYLSKKT